MRTIINMALSLYTVRIVLMALGQNDYGIYSLVAGVVSMLAFVTNSLVVTTQRFVSFYQGQGNSTAVHRIFNNSLIIHIVLGTLVVAVLLILSSFLFNGFLNIPPERLDAAIFVYRTVVLMLLLSFITAPFRALLISHENIVYISMIDVLDGILKVVIVTMLLHVSYDKLEFYGIMMTAIQLFNFIALSLFCFTHYTECSCPSLRLFSRNDLRELLSFAGWNVYGTGCIVGRQQGTAVILNRFIGAAVNAAYGIAFQISSYTNFLSSSLSNAIAPQIVKSEGSGDRQRALRLSHTTCKFMFFLLSAIGIPYIFEAQGILEWWLNDVPENTALFCVMVMSASLADSLTIGLVHINQAIGKIAPYIIFINTPKLLSLLPIYLCLAFGHGLLTVAVIYVCMELFSAIIRLPFLQRTANLSVRTFLREVTAMEITPAVICIITCIIFTFIFQFRYRFVATFALSIPVYAMAIYAFGLTTYERGIIQNIHRQIATRVSVAVFSLKRPTKRRA